MQKSIQNKKLFSKDNNLAGRRLEKERIKKRFSHSIRIEEKKKNIYIFDTDRRHRRHPNQCIYLATVPWGGNQIGTDRGETSRDIY